MHDFISEEKKDFKFKIGIALASALTGFIAGAIVASFLWYAGLDYITKELISLELISF